MKKKFNLKRIFYFSALLIFLSGQSFAQYHAAVGARGGKFGSGLTIKYFFYPDNASGFELLILREKIADGGWWFAPFYEQQMPFRIPLIQLPLDFIAGAGVHIGYFPKKYYKVVDGHAVYYADNIVTVGADLLVAFEYLVPIKSLPFAIGIEAEPFYEFVNKGPEFLDFAVTLKYVFKTD